MEVKTESITTLAELVPEVMFDVLVRIIPGLSFLFLIYFTVRVDVDFSRVVIPIDSVYEFAFLLVSAYVCGFLIELPSVWVIALWESLFHPATSVVFGSAAKRHFLSNPLTTPLDASVAAHIKKAAHKVFNIELTSGNASDVVRVMSEYLKIRRPGTALILVKIHAEAWMFKNLFVVSLLVLSVELARHRFRHWWYVTGLLLISLCSLFGFSSLHFLWHRRTYESFLANTTDFPADSGENEAKAPKP